VNFLVPYCDGTTSHVEWVHSKVAFDAQRAAAGERKFESGAEFDPRDAVGVLELAAYFDPKLSPLVGQLTGRSGTRFPTWQCVLNEAQRP
jgi:hypothetical protein